jgi:aminotransferase
MKMEESDLIKRLPEQFFASLVQKVNLEIEKGHDIINLGQGNPDLPTPSHIVDALKTAAEKPINHKYGPFGGHSYLKEAVAEFYKREYNVDIDPETEVAPLYGSKEGIMKVCQALLNEGDLALLPDPGYPDYLSGTAFAKAREFIFPLKEENDFLPDYNSFGEKILDEAKLLFLNYPSNPTSAIANQDFFDETITLAKKHQFAVVHDFAYGALGFDGEKPQSFLQSEGAKEVGVEFYTLSKTYNMAGWRMAFVVGNKEIVKYVTLLQNHDNISPFGAIQEAAAYALTEDQSAVEKLRDTYERRRNIFVEELRESGWNVPYPKGTFFCWFPVPEGFTSESFTDLLLAKAHVAVAPGNGFGKNGEGYVRIGLLNTEERLKEAAHRIGQLDIFQ